MSKFWGGILAVCVLALCGASAASAELYVALGDSYSSGTGTCTYFDSGCQRSATTANVLNTQVNSLTANTNWVTITIGGNDAGFSNVITECAPAGQAGDGLAARATMRAPLLLV